MFEALTDNMSGDVVTSMTDPRLHSFNVDYRSGEANVPHMDPNSFVLSLYQKLWNGVSGKCCLNGKIKVFLYGLSEQSDSNLPG
ncbi:MAG: hypothetical protein NPIRA02_11130 [Nitrospirales bacterium]|nr:MAG: hypothetical protein NPIRA02_11130 [Nitrospirales bacterium]